MGTIDHNDKAFFLTESLLTYLRDMSIYYSKLHSTVSIDTWKSPQVFSCKTFSWHEKLLQS